MDTIKSYLPCNQGPWPYQKTTRDTLSISDDDFKQTYVSPLSERYKTNLLGIEEGCHKKFKFIPVPGSIYSDKPSKQPLISDIQQSDLRNCAFLAVLKTIVRRYPQLVSSIISDVDDQHVAVRLFSTKENEGKLIQYQFKKTIILPFALPFAQIFMRFHCIWSRSSYFNNFIIFLFV